MAEISALFYLFNGPLDEFGTEPGALVARFIQFDGVDDVLGTENRILSPNAFTYSVWFKASGQQGLIAGFENNVAAGSTQSDRHLFMDEGFLLFGLQEGATAGTTLFQSTTRVDDGQWHNAIVVVNSSGLNTQAALYLDGERESFGSHSTLSEFEGFWRLGGGNLDRWPGVTNPFFSGYIGPFQVYNSVLSPEELAWLAQPPFQGIQIPIDPDPPLFEPDFDFDHEFEYFEPFIRRGPWVDVTADIADGELILDIQIGNVELFDRSVWVIRAEDGEEFLVGTRRADDELARRSGDQPLRRRGQRRTDWRS